MSHHWEDLLQHQTQQVLREPELSSESEGGLREPPGCGRLECPAGGKAEPATCPPCPTGPSPPQGLLGSCPDTFQGRNRGQELPPQAV